MKTVEVEPQSAQPDLGRAPAIVNAGSKLFVIPWDTISDSRRGGVFFKQMSSNPTNNIFSFTSISSQRFKNVHRLLTGYTSKHEVFMELSMEDRRYLRQDLAFLGLMDSLEPLMLLPQSDLCPFLKCGAIATQGYWMNHWTFELPELMTSYLSGKAVAYHITGEPSHFVLETVCLEIGRSSTMFGEAVNRFHIWILAPTTRTTEAHDTSAVFKTMDTEHAFVLQQSKTWKIIGSGYNLHNEDRMLQVDLVMDSEPCSEMLLIFTPIDTEEISIWSPNVYIKGMACMRL